MQSSNVAITKLVLGNGLGNGILGNGPITKTLDYQAITKVVLVMG